MVGRVIAKLSDFRLFSLFHSHGRYFFLSDNVSPKGLKHCSFVKFSPRQALATGTNMSSFRRLGTLLRSCRLSCAKRLPFVNKTINCFNCRLHRRIRQLPGRTRSSIRVPSDFFNVCSKTVIISRLFKGIRLTSPKFFNGPRG